MQTSLAFSRIRRMDRWLWLFLLLAIVSCSLHAAPRITCFNVTPSVGVLPDLFRIDVCADSLIPINRIELWRSSGDGTERDPTWILVDSDVFTPDTFSVNGYFLNTPVAAGFYWYGVHVVDYFNQLSTERDFGLGPIHVQYIGVPIDVQPPTISSFSVSPPAVDLGGGFTIVYNVSDTGGSGLKQIELWRSTGDGTQNDPNWQRVATQNLSGSGPVSDILSDGPQSPGFYWYGIHIVDNAGNTINERQAGFGPIRVQIKDDTTGPALAIIQPQNNQIFQVSPILVTGTATDDDRGRHGVNSVTVNSVPASGGTAITFATANWSATIQLTRGLNTIVVVATDGLNNRTTQQIFVTYDPPDSSGPLLTIHSSPDNARTNLVLSWPTNAVGFVLEYATNFPATTWMTASPAPVVIGTQNFVANLMTGGAKFYRLRK